MEEALAKAKAIIQEEVGKAGADVRRILLFGSRSRGDARPDSDWDFVIVVDRAIQRPDQLRLQARIGVRLVLEGLPSDVLILSDDRFAERKGDVGHIAYYAAKEGVVL